jgi:hypothetical protein
VHWFSKALSIDAASSDAHDLWRWLLFMFWFGFGVPLESITLVLRVRGKKEIFRNNPSEFLITSEHPVLHTVWRGRLQLQ